MKAKEKAGALLAVAFVIGITFSVGFSVGQNYPNPNSQIPVLTLEPHSNFCQGMEACSFHAWLPEAVKQQLNTSDVLLVYVSSELIDSETHYTSIRVFESEVPYRLIGSLSYDPNDATTFPVCTYRIDDYTPYCVVTAHARYLMAFVPLDNYVLQSNQHITVSVYYLDQQIAVWTGPIS